MKNTYYISVKRLLLLSFITLLAVVSNPTVLKAQSSQGTDFWIAFPKNIYQSNPRQLYITAEVNSTVDVNIVNPVFSTTVNIPAGTLATINLPVAVDINSNGVVENKGIHITSDNPVTVYGMSQEAATTDAYLALPVDALGTSYYVMTYVHTAAPSQMAIVATEDNTAITITPTATGGGFTAGVPGNIVLNEGQVFQLRSSGGGGDYTGSRVVSDKPVSVFGSVECTNIPVGPCCCDFIVQQMVPTSGWGQSFVTVPLATRTGGDIFRIMAQEANTEVTINGAVVANLAAGAFHEVSLASTSYNRIVANKPILVGQYSKSSGADGVTSDPFFTLLPPDEQFLNSYIVSAGTSNIPINFLNITSPTANTGNVQVDGATVAAGAWTVIPGTTFSGARVPVANGVHTVNSVLPIGLMVYGFGSYDSYGYLGGQAFGAVATVTSLTITPKTGSAPVNTNKCWEALLLDNFGDPVSGVRVDFNITGPNSASSGFAFTNASGIATFCYAGPNQGIDTIVAVVGALNDTASFTWTDLISVPLSDWAIYLGILLMLTFVVIRFRRMI
ncbi:MAG: hypothetical protein IH597_14250 [Bacteroidales bacterium]|nr:hypothetical protein [Bacteroidales bacterium]